MLKNLLILSLCLGLMACSDDDDAAQGGVSGAVSAASTVMNNVVASQPSSFTSSFALADYTNTNLGLGGDYGNTPQDFLGRQGSRTNNGSLLNKFSQAVELNVCLFTFFLPSEGDDITLAPEPTTFTFTEDQVSASGLLNLQRACSQIPNNFFSGDEGIQAGLTVRYQVEDISSVEGSQYERKISFDLGNTGTFSDFFYYTINSSTIKFIYVETQVNEAGKGGSYAAFEQTADAAKFEFVSFDLPDGGGVANRHDVYRLFLNRSTDRGYYLARSNTSDNAATKSIVTVATQEGNGSELAASYTINATAAVTDSNFCISTSDFSVATENSLSCLNGTITGQNSSGFSAEAAFTNIIKTDFQSVGNTTVIKFTDAATMLTADPAI